MNETQKAIVAAVDARGYLDGWTPAQLGARQVVKLTEELEELADGVLLYSDDGSADNLAFDLHLMADRARAAFNQGCCGRVLNVDEVVAEAADCYVVLSVLTHALEQMLGREIDLEALALAKATGDVKRGVR